MLPGDSTYKQVDTLGLRSHLLHAECDNSYSCIIQKKNICWLPPSKSQPVINTPMCPKPFTPECFMQPQCRSDALGTNKIDYVRVTCSSPPVGSSVIIDEYKFEIKTGYTYANNESVWTQYKCPLNGSSRNAPACLIPMSKLANHPYGLKDHAFIKGRVTATPRFGTGPTVTSNCNAVDRSPIHMRMPPKAISLTSTQTSNEATVCWNNPFYNPSTGNKINLFWTNHNEAIGSTNKADFAGGNAQDITDVAENCLKIDLKDGWTTFLAVADNSCAHVSTTISIQLTDCPTCHHLGGPKNVHGHEVN